MLPNGFQLNWTVHLVKILLGFSIPSKTSHTLSANIFAAIGNNRNRRPYYAFYEKIFDVELTTGQ